MVKVRNTPIKEEAGSFIEEIYDLAAAGETVKLDDALERKLAEITKEALGDARAKYKLEIFFGHDRSLFKPFPGIAYAFASGGQDHGGGDAKVYFCPALIDIGEGKKRTCGAPIDLKFVSKKAVVCPKCRNACKPVDLIGEVWARLTVQNWATLITRLFQRLEGNADIVIRQPKDRLIDAAQKEQEKELRGDVLEPARARREGVIYELKNIIRDLNTGADVHSLIKGLLLA